MKAVGDYSKQIQYNKTTALLIAAQTYRIFGIAFLWGMTQGLLDPAFAIPAGIGDILIGVTAIPFAIFLWKGYSWSKYAVVVWSVLGIADLVNAITLGLITNS
ncbi:MAG: MFS transporter, partial [Thermoproteota archaeon]|nr:MFS transporter [Thermoproteota archaeon]